MIDLREHEDDLPEVVRELTDGRGPDSVIDAVAWRRTVRPPWLLPFLTADDPLGVDEFAIHRRPLADAAAPYGMFQRKVDRAVKIMLKPVGMIRSWSFIDHSATCFASRTGGYA